MTRGTRSRPASARGRNDLLYPLTRKLGHLIEARTRDPRDRDIAVDAGLRQVVARLDALEERVTTLAERQEFVDRLLMENRPSRTLGTGTDRPDPPV